jgi:hypothetical protein
MHYKLNNLLFKKKFVIYEEARDPNNKFQGVRDNDGNFLFNIFPGHLAIDTKFLD